MLPHHSEIDLPRRYWKNDQWVKKPKVAQLPTKVTAHDNKGNAVEQKLSLKSLPYRDNILLRPQKALYRQGEPVSLTVVATESTGTVYLRISKDCYQAFTGRVELQQGRAQIEIKLPDHLSGTLRCCAYLPTKYGATMRDMRWIYVCPPQLQIAIHCPRNRYRPGEKAVIDFHCSDRLGNPVRAALGVTIVDQAVYALAADTTIDPQLYFSLDDTHQNRKNAWSKLLADPQFSDNAQHTAAALFARIPRGLPARAGIKILTTYINKSWPNSSRSFFPQS